MTWVVWLTGLPGSGKTVIARELMELLCVPVEMLRLDEFRKKLVPDPQYTEQERDLVYNAVGVMASLLASHGVNVVVDATAHRKKWRDRAREQISSFYEVYVKCPLEVCMKRESERKDNLIVSDIYRKALERKRKLEKGTSVQKSDVGDVIGVDVMYEEPEHPELVIETNITTPEEGARMIYAMLYPPAGEPPGRH
ncbi:MAG: adenylyl-sulfate kinase [Theionarchaea archaeon]|nr:adenylyl-sulfate kinase [Theionarchaea archaeon]MBU7040288.1 adenylyl-sulfate kinase [Theionarchaea archaeon]